MTSGKQKYFRAATDLHLDYQFYRNFDHRFLFNQGAAALFVSMCIEKKEFEASMPDVLELIDEFDNYRKSLRASLHFLELQQTEAIFALMHCCFQSRPHWEYMNSYRPSDLKKGISMLLAGDFNAYSSGEFDNLGDIVKHSIYCGYVDQRDPAKWVTSLENACHLLELAARKFLSAPEFLAFKHGVRLRPGGFLLRAGIEETPGIPAPEDRMQTIFDVQDGVTFIEKTQDKAGKSRIQVTSKQISPEQSLNLLAIGSRLLKTVKDTRLARLAGKTGSEIQTFSSADVDGIKKLTPVTRMSWWTS